MSMAPQLIKQFITNLLAALLATFVLARDPLDIRRARDRLGRVRAFRLAHEHRAAWNWYRFPTDFMVGNLLEQGIGWLLGGIAIAWWLGREPLG